MFIRFTARAFRKLLSIYVLSYFPFAFESGIWDLIVSVPDHCLSFYFVMKLGASGATKGYCNDARVRVGPPRGILMTLIAPVEPPGDTVVTLGYQTCNQEIR